MDEIKKVLEIFRKNYNRQVILYGPPGTSKTYSSTLIAANFLQNSNDISDIKMANEYLEKGQKDQYQLIQFHPSYNYEDFVRGIKVEIKNIENDGEVVSSIPNYKVVNRKFGEIAEKANDEWKRAFEEGKGDGAKTDEEAEKYAEDHARKYVLIIDEINRAPVASVLGELIYGLEYRGQAISTPYALDGKDEKLVIPKNLYIIGTMNTADRSIGSIDYAVRRRFAFIPLLSSKEAVVNCWEGNDLRNKVVSLFEEVQGLFEKENLADTSIQAEDIKIGHTYFLYDKEKCSDDDEAKSYMRYRIEYQIIPIIEEYMKDGLLKDNINLADKKDKWLKAFE